MTDSKLKVTKFDPKNPEDFNYIHWYNLKKLTKKEKKLYEKEREKYDAWKTEERIKREKEPREFPTGYRVTAQQENELILSLGNALKDEGFTVVYTTGGYQPEKHTIHESWAQCAIVKKNGQRVGSFRCWMAGDWHAKPVGWKMETNRGKGSNPGSWSDEKRLKKLESAVKYFNETAIPRESIEDELDKAEAALTRYRSNTQKARNAAYTKKCGVNKLYQGYSPDGTMELIMDAMEAGDKENVMELVAEHFKQYEELVAEVTQAEERETDYLENVVKPLRKLAKRAVPEVYS